MELHLSPRVIGKGSKGRTACGSAAYRSGSKIVDNDGVVHDFRHKKERVSGGVELPEGVSEELRNPQTLWQRHEIHDVRKDAQLYRDVQFSLPNELEKDGDYSACERVARGMAAPLIERGMCVQWDIHDKITWEYKDAEGKKHRIENPKNKIPGQEYKEIRNLHVHMMLTMRELNEDGTFGNKVREWNKFNGGLNIADLLRPLAAELMNKELEAIQSDEHVEHLSYADRGIDMIATTHVGVKATAMEQKGETTDRGENRRFIEWLNEIHRQNVKEAEKGARRLDTLISKAQKVSETDEAYRDWDALFAYLRDIRRSRAAIASEMKRLDKVSAAYKAKDAKYLQWAGCDPNNPAQELTINTLRKDLMLHKAELDSIEDAVMRHKYVLKAHNDLVYASKKVAWDEYQIERNKRGINYFIRRAKIIANYIVNIRKSVTIFDAIFNTDEYQAVIKKIRELDQEAQEVAAEYTQKRAELERNKQDLKQHKQDLKQAKKDFKDAKKYNGQDRGDR